MGDVQPKAETVICTFRVRADREEEFLPILRQHWPALHTLGLVTEEPSRAFRGTERDGRPYYVEIFTWLPGAAHRAHEMPEVLAVWERMEPCMEARDGKRKWEFPHVFPVDLGR